MAAGLQVFDPSGGIVLDITDRAFRLHGMGTVGLTYSASVGYFRNTASVSVPEMTADARWLVQAYTYSVYMGVEYPMENLIEIRNGSFFIRAAVQAGTPYCRYTIYQA